MAKEYTSEEYDDVRNLFACFAMQGLITRTPVRKNEFGEELILMPSEIQEHADLAFDYAEAMLVARKV